MITIVNYQEYDVSQSLIFHDVKKFKIDFSENIHDVAFGFLWDRQVVDMIDNEFMTIKFRHQTKFSRFDSQVEELGLEECGEKGHLSKYYSKKDISDSYGNVYCAPNVTKDHYLEGQY